MTSLIHEETVFVSDKTDQAEIFKEIASKLLDANLVTEDYLDHLIEREENYPTALPLSPINPSLPNIAIPHTESEFVKDTRIVPVKLKQSVTFKNMILPDEDVDVSFLFMILNNDEKEQAGLLQNVMDFINRQDSEELIDFFKLDDPHKIYEFLKQRF
ncbi:PTS sugar transporter subunit IIA [Streptococcus caviae]|uniref:PTS sugar transporter subunit IIA n=1 Tax=Streptococcus sp. 'caviae' TaxID=1915004 RepID=UPI00094BBF74|nr:PTS sugar transporter subunit IIA [Streptococcus sp. 'caviae']OLN84255.1 PTS mannitol transporter subunit IIB [Streptococcus sp. 'caviae']